MKHRLIHFQRKIFLIDGLGALLTAFLVGIVLTNFQEYIGMPREILITLGFIAGVFCIYSFSCFFTLNSNWKPFLKAIAIANTLYCITTIIMIFTLSHQLTILGVLYFIGEIIVIGILVYFESLILNRSGDSQL